MLTGVLLGQLGAEPEPKRFYDEMARSPEISKPVAWTGALDLGAYDALLLPGGHAPGMRQYLGSEDLQGVIRAFWATGKPVAAICHGVLPLARAGVLRGKKTTCLPLADPADFVRGPRVLTRRGTRDDDSPAMVVEDGAYVSARWPGDAYLFAKKLIERL